jgi:23S rRNA (guanosine2251-2'-O)-methyltransferase
MARKPKNKALNARTSPPRPKAKTKPAERRPAKASQLNTRPDTKQDAKGGYWIYGVHAALAAIANPARDCLRIVLAETAKQELETRVAEAHKALSGRPSVERLSRTNMESLLSPSAVHQGLAVLAQPLGETAIEDIVRDCSGKSDAAVVILDQATDPRNVGAVMRSAAAFGAAAVVVQDRNAPAITGALCKAASGAVERVPFVRVVNLARAIGMLKDGGFWAAGLDPVGGRNLAEADLSGRVALVLGAEGRGLRRLTRDTCDELVKVPVARGTDSLNLSNAAAVALYELARQRP